MGDLLGKDHRAPVLDGQSSTRSGSCVSAPAITPSFPSAIANMMTPPSAGEEEANSRHGEKSKIRSKINLFISGCVKTDPLPKDTDTYGECFYVSSPYSSALPRTSAGAPSSPASAEDTKSSLSSRERESEESKERARRLTTRRRTYKESVLKAAAPGIFHQAFVNHICKQKGPFSGNSIHWSSNHLIDYTKNSLLG